MKKCLLIVLLLLSGCLCLKTNNETPPPTNAIINKYSYIYENITLTDPNTDNNDIAYILKTFCCNLFNSQPQNWEDISDRENQYMSSLSTNYISTNYIVMASSNEIFIVDGFLDEISSYYQTLDTCYSSAPNLISTESKKLIFRLNDYEYNKIFQ